MQHRILLPPSFVDCGLRPTESAEGLGGGPWRERAREEAFGTGQGISNGKGSYGAHCCSLGDEKVMCCVVLVMRWVNREQIDPAVGKRRRRFI
jgi:hypothetical protein